jgi:hypothetical protein
LAYSPGHTDVAVAQPQRRGALPLVREPADISEFVAHTALGEIDERPTRADRAELARVTDQQQLGVDFHRFTDSRVCAFS